MRLWLGDPEKIKELYKTPANRRLKCCIIGVSIVMISLLIALIILTAYIEDAVSNNTILFMEGCTGVCALISVTLSAILLYRVNKGYIESWHDKRR